MAVAPEVEEEAAPAEEEPNEQANADEAAKPRRTVKPRPKFQAESLGGDKGLRRLQAMVCDPQKFDVDRAIEDPKRGLTKLLDIYRRWMYDLFPGNFEDMCDRFLTDRDVCREFRCFLGETHAVPPENANPRPIELDDDIHIDGPRPADDVIWE